jgi:hypothetical protein
MPKHRTNGPRWPGMLHSSKDRAKPIVVDFVGIFGSSSGFSPLSWAAAWDYVEILCSRVGSVVDATREKNGVWRWLVTAPS